MTINSISQLFQKADVNGDGRINAEDLKDKKCDQLQKNILKELGVDEGGKVEYSNTGQLENYVQQKNLDVDLLLGTSKVMGKGKPSLDVQPSSTANNNGRVAAKDIKNNHVYTMGEFDDEDQVTGRGFEDDIAERSSNDILKKWQSMETKEFNDWKGCLMMGAYDITAERLRNLKDNIIKMSNLGRPGQGMQEADFALDDEALLRKYMSCCEHLEDPNFQYKDHGACALETRFDEKPPRIKMLVVDRDFCNLVVSTDARSTGWRPDLGK